MTMSRNREIHEVLFGRSCEIFVLRPSRYKAICKSCIEDVDNDDEHDNNDDDDNLNPFSFEYSSSRILESFDRTSSILQTRRSFALRT
jgi:hypothetical protein